MPPATTTTSQPSVPMAPLPTLPPSADPAAASLMEPGEQMIVVVHRHPIGIIGLYLAVLAGILIVIGFFALITPNLLNSLYKQSYRYLVGGIVLALAVLIFFLFVATYVYRQSRLVVTNRSLIEVLQKSLFIRKISRLSMSNVEDVTADQNGILATFFDYGVLTIQTAGTLDNFIFPTCPNPNKYAHIILEAREAYAQSLQEEQQRALEGRPLI